MTLQIVSPSEINAELNKIWESLEGSNKMRASLFNLIFFTKKLVKIIGLFFLGRETDLNMATRLR